MFRIDIYQRFQLEFEHVTQLGVIEQLRIRLICVFSVMDDEPTSSHRPGDSAASRRMCGSADSTASDSDTADDAPLLASGSQSVRIDMPSSEKPASPHDRFPKERPKALLSFILLAFAAVLNEIVLSFVHERVPETPPLPDITFSLIPYYKDGLKICEYIMLASFASVLLLMLFHRVKMRRSGMWYCVG
ncbi:hypothetical protein TELCIR_13242 [Teladorsagia circumcincta]|uniref:Uncharacterized protein n=1 Tax=Teladorsagia circumcincta TaxID=45464 RepID=A0A2G9U4K5_TELCI|nr:hypothetical protein TELCIR_13242 [Teladorsagia circumcincta]